MPKKYDISIKVDPADRKKYDRLCDELAEVERMILADITNESLYRLLRIIEVDIVRITKESTINYL